MSLKKKNDGEFKDYIDDFGGSRSNMKLVYILAGLTVLTVALVVLLILFMNGTFGGGSGTPSAKSSASASAPADTGTAGNTTDEATPTPTATAPVGSGETVSLTIGKEVEQIPEGEAPGFTMGSGDKAGYIIVDNGIMNKGDLILANAEQPLDGTYTPFNPISIYNESILVMKYPISVNTTNLMLEKRAIYAYAEFLKGAQEAGFEKYIVIGAYSSSDENVDMRTGLSLTIGFTRAGGTFAEHPQGKHVIENAYLYGFVQRYTSDKKSITGVDHSSTHYRYVGFPHSYIMKSKNLALEEYVKYVRESGNLSVEKNGKLAYEVSYGFMDNQAADGKTACKISDAAMAAYNQGNARITVSGDNFAGFIVTVIYK